MISMPTNKLNNQSSVLVINDLTIIFGSNKAVDRISFTIKKGEIFGLLGPNGAGKTSTLSAIEGLIKFQSGDILVNGLDITNNSLKVKANIGVQLQANSFQNELTINQIIKLYAGLYSVALSPAAIVDSLNSIGLGLEAGKQFKQLSGGQQQRLSLYIANMHNPILLLLDEPTAGLDPQSRRQLWDTIEHNRQNGGSILLTTHSMEEAESVCDRVAIIDNGRVISLDTPKGLIEKHKHDPNVLKVSRGKVTLEDVFIGLTGSEIRE